MDLDWRIAYVEFEFLQKIIDYKDGRERESESYAVHTYSCLGEYMGPIHIRTWSKEKVPVDILIDTRSLKLLRAKCCPLELGGAMLEGLE